MKEILKVELFRLKKSVAFWVCFGLCAGLPLLGFLLTIGINFMFSDIVDIDVLLRQYSAEGGAFLFLTDYIVYASDCNILALICTAVLLCGEFRHGTVRNMILANKSRKQIYLAFFVMSLIVGTVLLLTSFTVSLVLFGTTFGFGNLAAPKALTNVLLFLLMGISSMVCVQTMVCMFMFGTRKTSLTLLFPLLITIMLPSLVSQIVTGVLAAVRDPAVVQKVAYFIPFYNWDLDVLTPSMVNVGMILLYNVVFAAIFFVSSFFSFQKVDLK